MTRALWTHLVKDLRIEWRSKDAINSMLFFALLVVVLFSLAFDPRGSFSREIVGGILCVATMFASVSALNQAWAREIRHQVLDAQRIVQSKRLVTLGIQQSLHQLHLRRRVVNDEHFFQQHKKISAVLHGREMHVSGHGSGSCADRFDG